MQSKNKSLISKLLVCFRFLQNLPFGGAAPEPKLSMFCALSQNYQHFFEKRYWHSLFLEKNSQRELSEKLKNCTGILVGQAVFELLMRTIFCMVLLFLKNRLAC